MALRIKKVIPIKGMTCIHCEQVIRQALTSMDGVTEAVASYRTNSATVVYDSLAMDETTLHKVIHDAGYEVMTQPVGKAGPVEVMRPLQLAGVGLLVLALYLIVDRTIGFNFIPEVRASMGYGMLFLVGLLTSLHCMAMCGGISLSQCLPRNPDASGQPGWKPSLIYNTGRILSYTLIGGVVGALGSVVSFPGSARGIMAILAGLFMIAMGVNMLGIFPFLRRLQVHLPAGFRKKLLGPAGERSPFVVGLLNGLMPCGPLQTMQLYALGTGSAFAGALSMMMFGLGTAPLMFGFGAFSTLVGKRLTKAVLPLSAMLVIVLGALMMQRGLSLGGITLPGLATDRPSSIVSAFVPESDGAYPTGTENTAGEDAQGKRNASQTGGTEGSYPEGTVQQVSGEVKSRSYPAITVKKGIPVNLNLYVEAANLNGCNNSILIPAFNIQQDLQPGDNWISFTPQQTGQIGYTCWMGMISSTITVVE